MTPNWFIGAPAPFELALEPPKRVRLIHREDLHITVAFLGGCGEERALAAWSAAEAFELAALEVTLEGTKLLGNRRKPTAITALLGRGREAFTSAMAIATTCVPPPACPPNVTRGSLT